VKGPHLSESAGRGAGRECASAWCSSCPLMVDLYFIVLLYDGMGEMSMHEGDGVWVMNNGF